MEALGGAAKNRTRRNDRKRGGRRKRGEEDRGTSRERGGKDGIRGGTRRKIKKGKDKERKRRAAGKRRINKMKSEN